MLVLGSQNSSNSNRLADLGRQRGKTAHLIDTVRDVRDDWFRPSDTVLVTAGAAPGRECAGSDRLPEEAIRGDGRKPNGREEHVNFPLPRELRGLPVLANG